MRMNYGLLQNWESLMQYGMVDINSKVCMLCEVGPKESNAM